MPCWLLGELGAWLCLEDQKNVIAWMHHVSMIIIFYFIGFLPATLFYSICCFFISFPFLVVFSLAAACLCFVRESQRWVRLTKSILFNYLPEAISSYLFRWINSLLWFTFLVFLGVVSRNGSLSLKISVTVNAFRADRNWGPYSMSMRSMEWYYEWSPLQ
jgi:hypothetical protein